MLLSLIITDTSVLPDLEMLPWAEKLTWAGRCNLSIAGCLLWHEVAIKWTIKCSLITTWYHTDTISINVSPALPNFMHFELEYKVSWPKEQYFFPVSMGVSQRNDLCRRFELFNINYAMWSHKHSHSFADFL